MWQEKTKEGKILLSMSKKCKDCQKPISRLDNEFYEFDLCLSCGIDRRVVKLNIQGTDRTKKRIVEPSKCINCGEEIKKLLSGQVCQKCQNDPQLNPEI